MQIKLYLNDITLSGALLLCITQCIPVTMRTHTACQFRQDIACLRSLSLLPRYRPGTGLDLLTIPAAL